MQAHTDTDTCHRQLSHTGLEEGTAEIAFHERMGLLQETVSLIRVRKVGRSHHHVLYLLSQNT